MKFSSMLQDGIDGSLSSKRIVTFLAFLLCAIAFIANLFFDQNIERFIFESMAYIAMAGLGATVAEKFSSREQPKPLDPYTLQQQPLQPPSYPRMHGTPLPKQRDPLI